MILNRIFSTCEIIPHDRVVKKYHNDPISLGFFENEVQWYMRFDRNPHVPRRTPKLLDYSKDTLVLKYVGESIKKVTIPVNFKNQLREIASFLKSHRCRHCDITPSNLLVKKDKIYLIDFAFALGLDEDPFQKWENVERSMLENLGGIYRAPDWPNDEYSLTKVYSVLTGKTNSRLFS